ncbi:MAG TPA: ABC transporter ATP-binding protein [Solirubrobacteraceae bacterium]|nr:ABC transporter ATP-binding protein [Solirubrobacteraceae bacterium]
MPEGNRTDDQQRGPVSAPLLEVRDLSVNIQSEDGVVHAVDHVSWSVNRGEVLGIVGESGSGKSVSCLSLVGLLPEKRTTVTGSAVFDGVDLLECSEEQLDAIRGGQIAMIFQDPLSSLHPLMSVGAQLLEAIKLHQKMAKAAAKALAIEMLGRVGIPDPARRMNAYPHELSGGMRQRVMIAMALINDPAVLVADEATTALDVTTQAQILDLLRDLCARANSAIVLITHDLGVVAEVCDHVVVMYAGRVAESGTVEAVLERPSHPYTWGLLGSMPSVDAKAARARTIGGTPPSLLNPPSGCRFHPRCPHAMEVCRAEVPPLHHAPDGDGTHLTACHLDEARLRVGAEGASVLSTVQW